MKPSIWLSVSMSLVLWLPLAAHAQDRRGLDGRARMVPPFQNVGPFPDGPSSTRAPRLQSWVTGWALTGTRPDAYEVRCDELSPDCGVPILRTKASAQEPLGTGSLTHAESAAPWRGHRVQVRAELRAGRVAGWGGLWLRIDGPRGEVLAFDNMQDRPLRGTTSFAWHRVVLDVAQEAERLSFGVMLHGPGAVFVRELQFEEAPPESVPTDLLPTLRHGP